jgi:cell division protein FtsB
MINKLDPEEEPIIFINWRKIFNALSFVGKTIWRALTLFLIVILKALTFIVLVIYRSYLGFKALCARNFKGIWIVLLVILVAGCSAYAFYRVEQEFAKQRMANEKIINSKNDQIDYMLRENLKLREMIKDLKDKLSYKQQRDQLVALGWKKVEQLPENVKTIIAKYSSVYGVNRPLIECIVANESGGRYNAVGDNGAAVGVAQYHLATFLGHRRQMGLSEEDFRTDLEASIEALCFSVSRGGIGNWTTREQCV